MYPKSDGRLALVYLPSIPKFMRGATRIPPNPLAFQPQSIGRQTLNSDLAQRVFLTKKKGFFEKCEGL